MRNRSTFGNKYTNRFVAIAEGIIADNMQNFALRLLERLQLNTPVKTGHAKSEWQFSIGKPPMQDQHRTDGGASALAASKAEISRWNGIDDAYIYNNARNPDEYMYLIKVNALTARHGTRFIERSILEAQSGL